MSNSNNINSDTKNLIKLIIEMTNMFQSFHSDTKSIIKQCLRINRTRSTKTTEGLTEVLDAILNMPTDEQITIKTLHRLAKETHETTKAFIITSLTDEKLKAMQNILLSINQNYSPKANLYDNKIAFCEELYDGIDTLSAFTINALDNLHKLITLTHSSSN